MRTLQKPSELNERCEMESRCPLGHYNERIRCSDACPSRGNSFQPAALVAKTDPILSPRQPALKELEFLTETRMEGMDHTEKSTQFARIECSRRLFPRRARKGLFGPSKPTSSPAASFRRSKISMPKPFTGPPRSRPISRGRKAA